MTSASANPTTFKKQSEVVDYLLLQGWQISTSKFQRDCRDKKILRNADGLFEVPVIAQYAVLNLQPKEKLEDSKIFDASAAKIEHEAKYKKVQAERFELKLQKEQGKLISREIHERELASRAQFFRREVENFIHLHGPAIIHLVDGDPSKHQELALYWDEKTADWMDAWAQDRDFVVDVDLDESETDEDLEEMDE